MGCFKCIGLVIKLSGKIYQMREGLLLASYLSSILEDARQSKGYSI